MTQLSTVTKYRSRAAACYRRCKFWGDIAGWKWMARRWYEIGASADRKADAILTSFQTEAQLKEFSTYSPRLRGRFYTSPYRETIDRLCQFSQNPWGHGPDSWRLRAEAEKSAGIERKTMSQTFQPRSILPPWNASEYELSEWKVFLQKLEKMPQVEVITFDDEPDPPEETKDNAKV